MLVNIHLVVLLVESMLGSFLTVIKLQSSKVQVDFSDDFDTSIVHGLLLNGLLRYHFQQFLRGSALRNNLVLVYRNSIGGRRH